MITVRRSHLPGFWAFGGDFSMLPLRAVAMTEIVGLLRWWGREAANDRQSGEWGEQT